MTAAFNRLVVFVTDPGFLVPTLVMARQVANQVVASQDRAGPGRCLCDLIVYLVDIETDMTVQLQETFGPEGLCFVQLETRDYVPGEAQSFRATHVSHATLARLVLADHIPDQYEHIVYMDGDMQVLGDITPLIAHDVAPGQIAAGNASFWLGADGKGNPSAQHRAYLDGLGIASPYDYFNAGVLAFRRQTWADDGPRALQFYLNHSELCRLHDQSALNAIFKGRREVLPPGYNFHTEYANRFFGRVFGRGYSPQIVHFLGPTKPWKHALFPWGRRYTQPYINILDAHPFLTPFLERPVLYSPTYELARGVRKLWLLRARYRHLLAQRRRFDAYLQETEFAI